MKSGRCTVGRLHRATLTASVLSALQAARAPRTLRQLETVLETGGGARPGKVALQRVLRLLVAEGDVVRLDPMRAYVARPPRAKRATPFTCREARENEPCGEGPGSQTGLTHKGDRHVVDGRRH